MGKRSKGDDTQNEDLSSIKVPEIYDPNKDLEDEFDTADLSDDLSDPFTPEATVRKIVNLDLAIEEHLGELEGLLDYGAAQQELCSNTMESLRFLDSEIKMMRASNPNDQLEWRTVKLHSLMNILAEFRDVYSKECDDESSDTDTKRRKL